MTNQNPTHDPNHPSAWPQPTPSKRPGAPADGAPKRGTTRADILTFAAAAAALLSFGLGNSAELMNSLILCTCATIVFTLIACTAHISGKLDRRA